MTIKEMIDKYDIAPETKDFGRTFTGSLRVRNVKAAKKDDVVPEITRRKAEIMAYFERERREKEEKKKDRQDRIDSIDGLAEVKKAIQEKAEWQIRFNQSFEGEGAVGGLGVGEYPKHDIEGMLQKYPKAAAYLKAEEYKAKHNIELSIIGEKALNEVIFGDYEKAMEDMERELKKFREKHLWD